MEIRHELYNEEKEEILKLIPLFDGKGFGISFANLQVPVIVGILNAESKVKKKAKQ